MKSLSGLCKDVNANNNSYPWNKSSSTSQEIPTRELKVVLRKHTCKSSWCPTCFKSHTKKRMLERLKMFDWRRTRHVVLSMDRNLFTNGKEAWEYVTARKLIANLVWNLRRTVGLMVIDWMWVLEWHAKDGFPHWHVFIEVEKEGRAGMIGGDLLRQYWPWGRWIMEKPIYDEKHWQSLVGYFNKHGYFGKDKTAQNTLPEWAIDSGKKIRRYGAMVLPMCADDKERVWKAVKWRIGERRERTYRMILSECGQKTRVIIENEFLKVDRLVSVPYKDMRAEFKGDYIGGVGYLVEIDEGELFLMADKYPAMLGLVSEIVEQEASFYEWLDDIADGR